MRITDEIARRRVAGHDVISLCAGEPQPRRFDRILAPVGYTGPVGTMALREAIATHYDTWYGVDIDPRQVAVTTGSSGAFQLVFLAAFAPGDRVALATPGYPAYRNILRVLGVEVVEIPVGAETRFQLTPELLDAAVRDGGALAGLIVASPANPTGTVLSREELGGLAAWARRNGARLVSDEIYHGITYPQAGAADPRGVTARELTPDAIIISSFSKFWGMAGWRLGWTILPDDLIARVEALASNLALAPPSQAQEVAMTAFTPECYAERAELVAGFARARSLVLEAHEELGWGAAAPSDGAFYYYAELGATLTERFGDSVQYARSLLESANVALVPGVDFDPARGLDFIRLSYAVGETRVAEAIDRILQFQR